VTTSAFNPAVAKSYVSVINCFVPLIIVRTCSNLLPGTLVSEIPVPGFLPSVGIAYAAAVASLPFTATKTSVEWSSACLLIDVTL